MNDPLFKSSNARPGFAYTYTYINYNFKRTTYSSYSTSQTYTSLQYLTKCLCSCKLPRKLHYSHYSSKIISTHIKQIGNYGTEPMHKFHFLLNMSMLLDLTCINFSVSYLIFCLKFKGVYNRRSQISSAVPFI